MKHKMAEEARHICQILTVSTENLFVGKHQYQSFNWPGSSEEFLIVYFFSHLYAIYVSFTFFYFMVCPL